jgi:hypothetical protein
MFDNPAIRLRVSGRFYQRRFHLWLLLTDVLGLSQETERAKTRVYIFLSISLYNIPLPICRNAEVLRNVLDTLTLCCKRHMHSYSVELLNIPRWHVVQLDYCLMHASSYCASQILRFFYKLKFCGNPASSKCHFPNSMCSRPVSVSHFCNSRNISNLFIVIMISVNGDLWSVIFDVRFEVFTAVTMKNAVSRMWSRVTLMWTEVSESAATCSRWFLAHGFLYPENGGDTFLRNGILQWSLILLS